MRKVLHISILLSMLLLAGCKNPFKRTDWNVSLDKADKRPYGTWIAYNSLKYYFPNAQTAALPKYFSYNNIAQETRYSYTGTTLLVLAGLNFSLTETEWEHLLQFVYDGNEVILFSSYPDHKILKRLRCYKKVSGMEEYPPSIFNESNKNLGILKLKNMTGSFGYDGHSIQSYFELDSTRKADGDSLNERYHISTVPDTLGYVKGNANMLRYAIGEGHITIHAAPLVLSNYFLLQGNNRHYLDGIWSTLPPDINHVYWHEYYKRSMPVSSANVLWRHPATRYATLLAIIALLLYVLFEGKRKQRIIPVIAPLQNTSVTFIETVGRLYYNKKDHNNLAAKMTDHFLEWVRGRYHINTSQINASFIEQLTARSGQAEETVRKLADMIHDTRLNNTAKDEAYLYDLYTTIQLFYKNEH